LKQLYAVAHCTILCITIGWPVYVQIDEAKIYRAFDTPIKI